MAIRTHDFRDRLGTSLWRSWQGFWSWWSTELLALLPAGLRHAVFSGAQRVFLEPAGDELVVSRGTLRAREEVARYRFPPTDATPSGQSLPPTGTKGAAEVVLCLPRDKVLTRSLTLPLAAEENLREVLAFEMDRQTPFTAGQVYYDFVVTRREPRARTLTLDLVLAPRRAVDQLLARLADLDLHPGMVTLQREPGQPILPVNLLPARQRPRGMNLPRRVNLALAILVLVLLFGAVSLPLLEKWRRIQALEPQLATAGQQAEVAHRLREKIDRLTLETRFLVEKKQASLPVLRLMDELTRLLPDDTWLQRLLIKGTEVQLQGQSVSAAALVPLLEASPLLENVRFRSPVTQVKGSGEERFLLSADIMEMAP